MRKICVPALAVLPGFVVVSPTAQADIDLVYDGMVRYEAIKYSYDSSAGVEWNSAARAMTHYAHAGLINFNDGAVQGYCIELDEAVSEGPVPYEYQAFGFGPDDYKSPLGESQSRLLDRMSYLGGLFDGYYALSLESGSVAAAFAMMTWELTHENFSTGESSLWTNQLSIDQGAVQFGDFSEAARLVFEEMKQSLFTTNLDGIMALNSNGSSSTEGFQDFVTAVPGPSVLALGAIAMLASRRRRS